MLPWKLRKSQILPVSQNLSSVYFSLAKFQLVCCNLSLAMIWQMTYTQKLPKLCSATLTNRRPITSRRNWPIRSITRVYHQLTWYNSLWLWRWLPHRLSKRQSLSTTTVLLRTTFTRTIKLSLLLKWLLGSNLSQYLWFLGHVVRYKLGRVALGTRMGLTCHRPCKNHISEVSLEGFLQPSKWFRNIKIIVLYLGSRM